MALIQKENINLVLRKKVCDIVSELANKISGTAKKIILQT